MINGAELLRGVDFVIREKNVSREVVFSAIEKAIRLAIFKQFEEEDENNVVVAIDRDSGEISARRGEEVLDTEKLGRIAAQAAKQMIIQLLKEEESTAVFNEYYAQKGELVSGIVPGRAEFRHQAHQPGQVFLVLHDPRIARHEYEPILVGRRSLGQCRSLGKIQLPGQSPATDRG